MQNKHQVREVLNEFLEAWDSCQKLKQKICTIKTRVKMEMGKYVKNHKNNDT